MKFTRSAILAAAASATAAADIGLVDKLGRHLHGAGALLLSRQTTNLQTFTGALGGIKADAITMTTDASRPFEVSGDTFPDFATAAGRSCDNQMNNCAAMANQGSQTFTVEDCDTQDTQCRAVITSEEASASAAAIAATASTSATTSSSSIQSTTATEATPSSTTVAVETTTSSSSPAAASSSVTSQPPTTTAPASVASTTTATSVSLVSSNADYNFFCEV